MSEILIYGDIGFEVTPTTIVAQLGEMEGPVTVRVDSYGGDVYAGISILNALRRYPDVVTVYVDGMAASAASYIAVGGADRLIMSPNSSMLVHGAWSRGTGNSAEFAELAENLAQITDNIASIYAEKSGKGKDFWLDVMKKDTTYSAEQAVEIGLADEVAVLEKSARAEQRHAVMASQRSRFLDRTGGADVPEIEPRVSDPPTPATRSGSGGINSKPSDGQNGDKMNILNQLAQELGKKPEDVRNALSGFFNETVETTVKVDVSYPQDTRIVPTETVTILPAIGQPSPGEPAEGEPAPVENAVDAGGPGAVAAEVIEGITFALEGEAEGFTASVDEKSGALKVTASSGVEVGAEAEFSVLVSGTPVPVKVTVRSLSEETEPAAEPADQAPSPVENTVTVDKHTYNELVEGNRAYNKVLAERARAERHARVDAWVTEGRISASARDEAIKVIDKDEKLAEEIYGARAVNTVPRREIGNVGSGEPQSKVDSLLAKANSIVASKRK